MRAIFISYRRQDTEGQAGRLFKDLVQRFGPGSVFMDVVDIEPGRDYRRVIDQQVASCGVLLAVMGRHWADAVDAAGRRRLDEPADSVRLETAAALRRDIPVIPVLVQGAAMPRADQLPAELADLSFRNGVELTHARWDSDVELLVRALKPHVDSSLAMAAPALPAAPLPVPVQAAPVAPVVPVVPTTPGVPVAPSGPAVSSRARWQVAGGVVAALITVGGGYLAYTRTVQQADATREAEARVLADRLRADAEAARQALAQANAERAAAQQAAASSAEAASAAERRVAEQAEATRLAQDQAARLEAERQQREADARAAAAADADRRKREAAAARQAADMANAERLAADKAAKATDLERRQRELQAASDAAAKAEIQAANRRGQERAAPTSEADLARRQRELQAASDAAAKAEMQAANRKYQAQAALTADAVGAMAQTTTYPAQVSARDPCEGGTRTVLTRGTTTIEIRAANGRVDVRQHYTGSGEGYEVRFRGQGNYARQSSSYDLETAGDWTGPNGRRFATRSMDRVSVDAGGRATGDRFLDERGQCISR